MSAELTELSGLELAVMAYLAEVFVIHLQIRRDAFSFSLSEVPLVLGLFFCNPLALIVGQLVGRGTALVLNRHQSALKATFNPPIKSGIPSAANLIQSHAVLRSRARVSWAASSAFSRRSSSTRSGPKLRLDNSARPSSSAHGS